MLNYTALRYNDETDRAFGIAGMTIAMVLWDGEPYLASVSLDSPVGSSIEFTPAFGFNGNPRLMASLAWREHLKQFEMISAMIMGNTLCRSSVHDASPLSNEKQQALRALIVEEGHERCSLEDDEIDVLYNRILRNLDRAFTHPGVASLARNLAETLQRRRRLSASEVFEILAVLNNM